MSILMWNDSSHRSVDVPDEQAGGVEGEGDDHSSCPPIQLTTALLLPDDVLVGALGGNGAYRPVGEIPHKELGGEDREYRDDRCQTQGPLVSTEIFTISERIRVTKLKDDTAQHDVRALWIKIISETLQVIGM